MQHFNPLLLFHPLISSSAEDVVEGQLHRFSMHPKLQGGRLSGGWGVEMRYGISSKVFLFPIINSATLTTHTHTSSESSSSHLSSFVFVWGESISSVGVAKLSTSVGILAHLLRVVMAPKYYAMRFGLYTPIIL